MEVKNVGELRGNGRERKEGIKTKTEERIKNRK